MAAPENETDKPDRYTIRKLPAGGFVVLTPHRAFGEMEVSVFAASTLDEALGYVRRKLDPDSVKRTWKHGISYTFCDSPFPG